MTSHSPPTDAPVATVQVLINDRPHTLPASATVADAVAAIGIQPPFAAAVNLQFVPRSQHALRTLNEGDRVELIAPITGG